jgi:hypothetical protein
MPIIHATVHSTNKKKIALQGNTLLFNYIQMEIVLALGILVREDLYVMELAMNQKRIA